MIAVTIRPERAQINDDALESFWVSARQPCIFKLQRRDYELISCHEGVGAITVLKAVYNAAIATEVVAGDQLYWASTLDDEGNAGKSKS